MYILNFICNIFDLWRHHMFFISRIFITYAQNCRIQGIRTLNLLLDKRVNKLSFINKCMRDPSDTKELSKVRHLVYLILQQKLYELFLQIFKNLRFMHSILLSGLFLGLVHTCYVCWFPREKQKWLNMVEHCLPSIMQTNKNSTKNTTCCCISLLQNNDKVPILKNMCFFQIKILS